jgi:type I restriction enzyme M protein
VNVKEIDKKACDLSVKNLDGGEGITHRSAKKIMEEIAALDAESAKVLKTDKRLLARRRGGK